jgi:predicted flap endonuclease-1-like 5' DNA nuclease
MTHAEQPAAGPAPRLRTQLGTFARRHRRALQITGLVAVAGVAGGVGGLLVAKGWAAGKSAAAVNLALAAKGGPMTHAGAASLPMLLNQSGGAGTAVASPAAAGAALQNAVSLFNTTASNTLALADRASGLVNFLSTNAVPLTLGAVGGGAAGVGVAQGQARKVQTRLDEQAAQTETLRTETAQMQQTLSAAERELSAVQATLAQQTPSSQPPRDDLEAIRGIGRVFAQRLNEAGIYTFADLAAQTPEALDAIIGTNRAAGMFDPAAWIEEARQRMA